MTVEELNATVEQLRAELDALREWVRPVVEGHQIGDDEQSTPLGQWPTGEPPP